jgi:Metallo-peptidase family M12/Calx-beta domain/Reprolysin family propeptide
MSKKNRVASPFAASFYRHAIGLSLILIAVALIGGAFARYSPRAEAQDKTARMQQDLAKVFRAYEELNVDLQTAQQRVKTDGRLSLATLSHRFDLQLQLNDLRAPNYRAEEVVNGRAHDLPRGEANTFAGTVAGLPNTDARFTIDGSHLEGMILTPDETYFIEPAQKYSRAANSSDYLLYSAADVQSDITATCADTLAGEVQLRAKELFTANSVVPNAVVPMRVVEFATEADDEYVTALGGSSAANADILTIMNQVDAIYRRDVGLTFSIVFQHTWSGGDDYTTNGDYLAVLNEFANYWNAHITTPRDEAHMWTGRSLGGPDGIAFQGTVCRIPTASYGTSIRETIAPFRVSIPAHEIGHNFNASHCDGQAGCDNTIMVTTQTQSNTLTFCQFSINEMMNYVNANNSCLSVATASTVQLSSAAYAVNEGDAAGQVTVTVNRIGDTSGAASVNYATSDTAGLQNCTTVNGRASERCDYTTSVGTVRFAAGEASKTFNIPIINDVWIEGAETFTVSLSNAVSATLGTPVSATVTITDAGNDVTPPTNNPIDGVEFFIRQQYLDILGRQPDATGLQNWINTLAPCPNGGFGEPPTSDCDRLHVAAGFFQSDEFLNRGYWAFRMYMVAFNQRPTYAQFIPDMAQVGGPKSPAEEEASKATFAESFVQRSEFTARYPGLHGQALANALVATAGLPGYTVQAGETDGQILRHIAERQTTLDKFLVEGTVSILYFGFQRRDPDAVGYQNNVATLTANPNNLRHMIFIFIYSTEYRQRFGPP